MSNIIKLPDSIKMLCLTADIHGNLELIKYYINHRHLTNTCIIICGDVGLGFQPKWEQAMIDLINKKLVLTNCYVVGLRGNHSNPACFQDISIIKENGNPRNWINVPDYTIINVCDKNILCVGGATSIDRTWRIKNGIGYWSDEQVKYQPKVDEKIDIICSHSAPSFAFPTTKGAIVDEYAAFDPTLLEDIKVERETLDKVYNDYKDSIKAWYYGHFHRSMSEYINGVHFRCCNIGELVRYIDDDFNLNE